MIGNARRNSDAENARIESDNAVGRVVTELIHDDMELYKHFNADESFERYLTDTVFDLVYHQAPKLPGK